MNVKSILDHWEMCTDRNQPPDRTLIRLILDHWEMCTDRNY